MATIKEEYRREVKRIQGAIRRAKKKGFAVPNGIIPPKPKRLTAASVRRLKAITPESIRKRSYVVDPATGEAHRYRPPQKKPRQPRKKKQTVPKQTRAAPLDAVQKKPETKKPKPKLVLPKADADDLIYENWKNRVMARSFGEGAQLLARFFANWENTIGKEETVRRVNQAIENGVELRDYQFYSADGAMDFINEMLDFFPTLVNQFQEISDLMDYFDEWEDDML